MVVVVLRFFELGHLGSNPTNASFSQIKICLTITCIFQFSFTGKDYLLSECFYSVIIKIQILA